MEFPWLILRGLPRLAERLDFHHVQPETSSIKAQEVSGEESLEMVCLEFSLVGGAPDRRGDLRIQCGEELPEE